VGGGEEPVYLPGTPAKIIFTHDYFSSALHEVAHWCIAGKARREQVDYGYWYVPDGRTYEQQMAFEQVEIKPQAVEWVFNRACGYQFRLSADNLDALIGASEAFKIDVLRQAQEYCEKGLPKRAQRFASALAQHFCTDNYLHCSSYQLDQL